MSAPDPGAYPPPLSDEQLSLLERDCYETLDVVAALGLVETFTPETLPPDIKSALVVLSLIGMIREIRKKVS